MRDSISHWITLFAAVAVGVLGLFLTAGAKDDGMYVAGLLLTTFGVLFAFTRIAALTDYPSPDN